MSRCMNETVLEILDWYPYGATVKDLARVYFGTQEPSESNRAFVWQKLNTAKRRGKVLREPGGGGRNPDIWMSGAACERVNRAHADLLSEDSE